MDKLERERMLQDEFATGQLLAELRARVAELESSNEAAGLLLLEELKMRRELEEELAKKDVDRWLTLHANWQRAEDELKRLRMRVAEAASFLGDEDQSKVLEALRG